jgi:hypothetical protein
MLDNRSLCLVNHLHSFFIRPATVHFDENREIAEVGACAQNASVTMTGGLEDQ